MAARSEDEFKDVTSNEEKELRRVYDYLCNFAPKHKLRKQMKPLLDRKAKIMSYNKNPEAVKIVDDTGKELTPDEIKEELERIEAICEKIQAQIDEIESRPNRKIHAQDLQAALLNLNQKTSKVSSTSLVTLTQSPYKQKEVEDMIWEVDENLDGCVDWDEFHLMFQRNIKDKTGSTAVAKLTCSYQFLHDAGLEPFQLFNVVQFMMYDRDASGAVSVDETMHMLYARYGKDRLEAEMRALFGDDLKTADGDGSLTFADYLKAVNVRLPKQQPALAAKKKYSSRRK